MNIRCTCYNYTTVTAWCNKCDPGKFLKEGKTSGDLEMDKSQLKTVYYYNNLEWVPYDRFQDIEPIGEGGFAIVFSATLLDGKPTIKRIVLILLKLLLKT